MRGNGNSYNAATASEPPQSARAVRIGNEQYARENESFGLTTMRGHQVRVRAGRLPQVLQRRPWGGRQYFGAYVALTHPEVRRDGLLTS